MAADVLTGGARSDPVRLLGLLGIGAGLIHVLAMGQHLRQGTQYVVFFAIVAAAQLGWGSWMYRHPAERRWLATAAAVNGVVAIIWALSRTVGVPLAGQVGQVEAPGLTDVVATTYEVAIAAVAFAIMQPGSRLQGRLATISSQGFTRITAALVTATASAMLLGGHAH